MSAWEYIEEHRNWRYVNGTARVEISPRGGWCDRGRWIATVSGIGDIDAADAFPRYFMDLERAKAEMLEWLDWRMSTYQDTQINRRLELENRFADLHDAISRMRWQVSDAEWEPLVAAYNVIRDRVKP
jgi:hypothetical protein